MRPTGSARQIDRLMPFGSLGTEPPASASPRPDPPLLRTEPLGEERLNDPVGPVLTGHDLAPFQRR